MLCYYHHTKIEIYTVVNRVSDWFDRMFDDLESFLIGCGYRQSIGFTRSELTVIVFRFYLAGSGEGVDIEGGIRQYRLER